MVMGADVCMPTRDEVGDNLSRRRRKCAIRSCLTRKGMSNNHAESALERSEG
jgi:hypothetical protein